MPLRLLNRQYLNESEVWGGLVVEVTKSLEKSLGGGNRSMLRGWFHPWLWPSSWLLLSKPMRQWAAVRYNLRTRKLELLLRCVLPVLATLVVVGVLAWVGVAQIQRRGPVDIGVAKNGTAKAVALVSKLAETATVLLVNITAEGLPIFCKLSASAGMTACTCMF